MSSGAFAILCVWCVALSVTDIRRRRLPNALTGWGALSVFGYAVCTTRFSTALVGAVLLSVPYLLVHLALPDALGAGDAKLAVGLGAAAAFGGGQAWVTAAVLAPVLTAGTGIILLGTRRIRAPTDGNRPGTVPHGPAMCLATVSALAAMR